MTLRTIALSALIALLLALPGCRDGSKSRARLSPSDSVDVVVYGATPGGIVAAIAAKRSGRTVALLEPGRSLGGIITGGLGFSDVCATNGIGATAREFFKRVGQKYGDEVRWNFEPHVGEQVFKEMLAETGIEVSFEQQLQAIEKEGRRILAVKSNRDRVFGGRVFIDASYEGDLLAAAGVSYAVGRDSRERFGETLAGLTQPSPLRQFREPISAYDEYGALLPGVHTETPGEIGSGDDKVMAYNYRFCMTRNPENKTAPPAPAIYDPFEFELLRRLFERDPELTLAEIMSFHHLVDGKFCINRRGPFSTDLIGGSWDWPEAGYAERVQLAEEHKDYTLGLLKFLAEDPAVPEHVRSEMSEWGLCLDEFIDSGHFPEQLYVREGRRMLGEYVLSETDLLKDRFKRDVIGLASCPIEVHHVQRIVKVDGTVANEGLVGLPVQAYAIPYRSIVPQRSEADNLLVPVAVSASQIAYSSLRMEPVFMILGHSAGVAASMAVERDRPVQDIDIKELQAKLRSHTQVL